MAPSEDLSGPAGDTIPAWKTKLDVGMSCLLNVMGRHFLVKITEVGQDTLRVTFPAKDYPIEKLRADLEFYDQDGFYYYSTEVVQGPAEAGGCLVLTKPTELKRNLHRECCRVTTDLTVQVKDQVHVRRYDAGLVDLSAGGALIQTEAPFDFSTTIEMTLSLPGESTHVILGEVIHAPGETPQEQSGARILGIRFTDVDAETSRTISRYIWRRLQEVYARVSSQSEPLL